MLPDLHFGHKSHWSPTGIGRTCHQHIQTYGNDGKLYSLLFMLRYTLDYVFHKIIKFMSNNSQKTLLFISISIYKPFHCNFAGQFIDIDLCHFIIFYLFQVHYIMSMNLYCIEAVQKL